MSEPVTEDEVQKPKRRFLPAVGAVSIAVGLLALMIYWFKPPADATKAFEQPKLTSAHLDEQPFMRVPLGPGESYRPLEVMEGTRVAFTCEVVSRADAPSRFVLKAFGKVLESSDCRYTLDIPAEVGLRADLEVTFHDGGASQATDVLTVPAIVTARHEGLDFHALEDAAHKTVQPGSVPDQVFVYARAVTKLPGDGRDYAALFFTADPANGVPVLELMPTKEGDKPLPMTASVIRYRSWGPDLSGYAFWSPEPIRTGGRQGDRVVTDLYVILVRRDQVQDIFAKVLKVEQTGPETLTVTPQIRDAADLKALAVNHLVSLPLHVVRGPAGSAESGTRTTPVPPPAAPAPVAN